ncbi:multicopper oxidase family protein [Ectobacillus ponti]|uniref:Multicopper oxidase domain-containing protein n=1 Tax=Ectobacillus ponti TaxID=2961894 RepID=A0AA41XBG2_9BACI|nr:multicopper oxidase domain-containing protein [Ectobacillus ponti]MCP8970608.1 multicopper oxidase domain-containing protein [Ectobacillus ponti]
MQGRTKWLILSAMIAFIIALLVSQFAFRAGAKEQALPLPPLLKDQNTSEGITAYTITARTGHTEFIRGKQAETAGYNGAFLGPVLRMKKGDEVTVKVNNQLGEATTVHWHGLEVPGSADGGVYGKIADGTSWQAQFKVDQPAATAWFHPHLMHETGKQVYKGLAGLIYIEDDESTKLAIPRTYGEDDFPLVLQDRMLTEDGQMPYKLTDADIMYGKMGGTQLVNGAVAPTLTIPKGLVRLRVLNGANARIYTIKLSNAQFFWQIASDGGFLPKPVQVKELELSPAERAELLVDAGSLHTGDIFFLQNGGDKLMTFKVGKDAKETYGVPESLVEPERLKPEKAVKRRQFVFGGMGKYVNINGKQMDMNRMDERVGLNTVEIWEISNPSAAGMSMSHPFHAHGVQFQLLSRNGGPPPANETGWKDTIHLRPDERVEAIARFRKPGVFMYHCHILEHEDAGMMGQFEVK